MSKIAIYRNNNAYQQFLAPVLAAREDFEVQVFPVGTPETNIIAWLTEHSERLRSMENVYLDNTCYDAGKKVSPSVNRQNAWMGLWADVSATPFDHHFHKAAKVVMTKASVEETVAEVIRRLLAKEVPTRVYVVTDHMGDHDLFGSGRPDADQDAERLRKCLVKVTGRPAYYLDVQDFGIDTYVKVEEQDINWVFIDRHFKGSKRGAFKQIPSSFRIFEVPIENLVSDAIRFGIELDAEAYPQAVREIVATW